jgi:hypothetical protein
MPSINVSDLSHFLSILLLVGILLVELMSLNLTQ